MKFEKLAKKAANDELNVGNNKSWRDKRYDGKRLWQVIDWSGKTEEKNEDHDSEDEKNYEFQNKVQEEAKKNNHEKVESLYD